ncbi:hypothetical protein [Bradyrhizobium sp. RP6]|nr:hypothetical protein [Bradyrhizobium sp. RP6]
MLPKSGKRRGARYRCMTIAGGPGVFTADIKDFMRVDTRVHDKAS